MKAGYVFIQKTFLKTYFEAVVGIFVGKSERMIDLLGFFSHSVKVIALEECLRSAAYMQVMTI